MPARRQVIELKVVLDTNAIWVESESELLRREVSELVLNNTGDAHLAIRWILPEVVVNERLYQMQREGAKLLPHLSRLELIIGHPLNISEELVNKRIAERVNQQVQAHNLTIQNAAYGDVDWNKLVSAAVNRKPPFEPRSEKGFRDAIITETFAQIVDSSPTQATRCRVVLLTGDKLLQEAVRDRVVGRDNVLVKSSAEDVLELINTLMSDVGEQYIQSLQPLAARYFLEHSEPKSGAYYVLQVRDKITTDFAKQLAAVPPGADRRSSSAWLISPPRFVKKDRQRVFWTSRITIPAKAHKSVSGSAPLVEASHVSPMTDWTVGSNIVDWSAGSNLYVTSKPLSGAIFTGHETAPSKAFKRVMTLGTMTSETVVATGKSVVDVTWSASVTVRRKFSQPKLESVEFVETVWNESST